MRRSDEPEGSPIDWRGWMALAWMAGFGLFYALMIVREKAPNIKSYAPHRNGSGVRDALSKSIGGEDAATRDQRAMVRMTQKSLASWLSVTYE
ncbi:MAG TPA: hypothetical protein VGH33_07815 [Isosphaeraceae bacterium]|jgi:hypothetical protein